MHAGQEFADLLAARGDADALAELRDATRAGFGGSSLLKVYRDRELNRHIRELDCNGDPVYAPEA